MRKAVVLFNLGGPDNLESVQPFLYNLFNDPAIVSLPFPFRALLARLISTKRAPVAQDIYRHLGNKSPLLEETEKQAAALTVSLNSTGQDEYRAFICMRYWHPMSQEVVANVKAWQPDEIILLPLYPQFSTTTTGSSFTDWDKQAKKQGLQVSTRRVCCYPMEKQFITAHAETIRQHYDQLASQHTVPPRILFSAHGLPQKVVDAGDPYQWQVEQTAQAIVKQMAINELDWIVCYQSKVGPLAWLTPSTETEISRAGEDKKPLIVIPVAFVSEHSETLVELDIEYKELADHAGVPGYSRVPALTVNPAFIEGLAAICKNAREGICPEGGQRICPPSFSKCACAA